MSKPRRMHATEGDDHEPAGTLIASGVVPGRAVSWKAPGVARNGGFYGGRDYKRFKEWKQTVQVLSRLACRRKGLYRGPVEVLATFYLRPGGNVPDTSNLFKAFEDGLQDAVIHNDRQVAVTRGVRVLTSTEPERVEWEVRAI
jgi:Holliday junction resolvase RusA-like endonuclease